VAELPEVTAFTFLPDDPLATEHAAVMTWVNDGVGARPERAYFNDVDLKAHPSGQMLLDGKPDQSRRFLLAAVVQVQHWDRQLDQIRATAANEMQRINAHHLPGWAAVWVRRRHAEAVVSALMRRSLPLQNDDLIAILRWCNNAPRLTSSFAPIGPITRALERYAAKSPIDADLREALKGFAARLRLANDNDATKLGTTVEQLFAADVVDPPVEPASPATSQPAPAPTPAPAPAPAGTTHVLEPLKRLLGMAQSAAEPVATAVGPDRFPLIADSPLRQEHERLSALLDEVVQTNDYYKPTLTNFPTGKALLATDIKAVGKVALAAAERHVHALMSPSGEYTDTHFWHSRSAIAGIVAPLLHAGFEVDRNELFDMLLYFSVRPAPVRAATEAVVDKLIAQAESETARSPLSAGERFVLWLFRASLVTGPPLGAPTEEVARVSRLVGDGAKFYLAPGEAWSDLVNTDLTRLEPARALKWVALFKHALSAGSARPSTKWLATGDKLLNEVGGEDVQEALLRWLPAVAQGQTIPKLANYAGDTRGAGDVMNEENATALRGLLWLIQKTTRPDELTRATTQVALSAYKKVPGIGPRAVKVGNAAVYALSEMKSSAAVGQLAMLKVRIKFGTAQKEIEKAFTTAAEALGMPRDQIEELGVPSYGLEEVGLRRESFGDYRAEVLVTGSDAELKWTDAKGKTLKSVPAKVKSDCKDDLKELQQSIKDIQSMLPAQRDRLDSLFLLQKTWSVEEWSERYLKHPLIGTIAQRLIWCVDGVPALFQDGQPTDVRGAALVPKVSAPITLWHPIACHIDQVTAWRRRLEDLNVSQPFKQAHREVYLLTDAERNTHTYSNRFAAHVLRQHQFSALCAARGWKNKLRLMVDDTYPPASKELPQWGLRAEYWVEGIGEVYGTDTNDSGVYLRLSTDQVRFYRTSAAQNWAHAGGGGYHSVAVGPGPVDINEPLPLETIPALVFSEIMRDVDLFVGVSSVGNDPSWQDGGPDGRFQTYWQNYSFGELSGTAATRKQVLERLVPRLKIADRCSFVDRFLVVRGHKRTYKIHLGSGNILMEPNDQYLCIVPDSRSRITQGELFLPFEGDSTLSIILSKALLLADDSKIKDPTINRQIDGR
jgi:hypothetical protein